MMPILKELTKKKFIVPETAIGLLFCDKQFIQILSPGVYHYWNMLQNHTIEIVDITQPLIAPVDQETLYLAKRHPEAFAEHLLQWETSEHEVGLLYQQDVLKEIKAPGQQGAYWKGNPAIELRKINILEQFKIDEELARLLTATKTPALRSTILNSTVVKTIADGDIGLLEVDGKVHSLLPSGMQAWWNFNRNISVRTFNRHDALNPSIVKLTEEYPALFAEHIQCWETGEHEVGLVYQRNTLQDILPPAQQGAYWKTSKAITITKLDISDDFTLDKNLSRIILSSKNEKLQQAVMRAVTSTLIPEGHIGFLEVDGDAYANLAAGSHTWWAFNRKLQIKQVDLRLQNMEVNGQEILTKDRVSLRINLSATWQVIDAERIKAKLADMNDFLYRELQLALRTVVSTQTLDELLEDKNSLNTQVMQIAEQKVEPYGIELRSVGARDLVLPGEMKTILAEVVEAQKMAEANLIKRREETQATRSLHNTAKVMEGNPILLRLKELEVLEKITSNVQHLNVYGGLNGVMNDLVKIEQLPNK